MLAASIEYGLTTIDESILKISNTPGTFFLQQAELKAIKQGLKYKEREDEKGIIHKWYYKDGKKEGVKILIFSNGNIFGGEIHLNKLNGCGVDINKNLGNYWGNFNDHKRDGFGIYEWPNGKRYIGQW